MPDILYEVRNESGDWLNPKWTIRRNNKVIKRSKQHHRGGTMAQDAYEMANRVALQLNVAVTLRIYPDPLYPESVLRESVVTPEAASERRAALWDICRRATEGSQPQKSLSGERP